MKRPIKVRWHPRLLFSIGILFLLFAGAMCFGRMAGPPADIQRGNYSGPGTNFTVCAGFGVLLTGIGIYALLTGKD
jgi:hypothetical protein